MTRKEKLEQFDAVKAERDKLELAIYDLICASRFPFVNPVTVDCGKELDGDYADLKFVVSVSHRGMPIYMVQECGEKKRPVNVTFWTESEVSAHRENMGIYWRAVRHGVWKIGRNAAVRMEVA